MVEVMVYEIVVKKISDWYEEIKKYKIELVKVLREQLFIDL